jgi:hypothetical protein
MKSKLLVQAARSQFDRTIEKPSASAVVEELLALEKHNKSLKQSNPLEQLLGTWRLIFVTGTKKTRQRAGIVLGAGRYLPNWVEISLSYRAVIPDNDRHPTAEFEVGWVYNQVNLGVLQLSLHGPLKFSRKNNLLAFDFTQMCLTVLGAKLYDGYISEGRSKEQAFDTERIGKQAFFNYFWLEETAIAARGKGGGLALWAKQE